MRFPVIVTAILLAAVSAMAQAPAGKPALYNTAKQKLRDGKPIAGHTISRFDVEAYCEAAKHYDYTWFEMQHSTLTFADIEKMIGACPKVGAIPMIRMADEQESSLQHATDIGVLGVVMPTVDTVEKALQTAKYSRYPPDGRRSSGGAQAPRIWGADYAKTFNDNMLVVVMLETPIAIANAYDIAKVPGIDVVIIGNNDLSHFSGFAATDPRYQQMLVDARDSVHRAGKLFGTANGMYLSNKSHPLNKDIMMVQNGPPNDGWTPPAGRGGGRGGRGGAGAPAAEAPKQ
jgi:2-keto-3-deoxy-L-rhamnonate aldolase RhmA